MLPYPVSDHVPKILRDVLSSSPDGQALVDKLDEYILEWSDEILEMQYFKLPERCPAKLLNELGYMVGANILSDDSERTKRIKIYSAIAGHKLRGSWTQDAKKKIDAIALGDSQIFSPTTTADWVLLGGESSEPDNYWSSMGVDGIDDLLGIDLLGGFDEATEPGNIYIDVDNDSLTAAEVDKLVLELEEDVVPSYFRVVLGYLDGGGNFIEYVTMD